MSSTASQYAPRYVVNDYLQWKGDWELWNGIAIAMTPSPFGLHQNVLAGLLTALRIEIDKKGCRATALSELDWIVSDDTLVRPDVVVCGDVPTRHLESPPGMVAEILSPSTRQNDLTYKRDLYAREGVAIYLIVDPESQSVEQLELLQPGIYQPVDSSTVLKLKVCEDCLIEVNRDGLFR